MSARRLFAGAGCASAILVLALLLSLGGPLHAQRAESAESTRHLPGSPSGWRITGEIGTLDWPVFLTAREAASTRRFRVAYRSSASVLPDASRLALIVNDVVVGRSPIRSPAQIKPIDFEIAPGLLQAGFNSVRFSVEQQHRVDCSLGATYELWTELLPDKSGFLSASAADASPIELNELAALRPQADGALPIEVMLGGRLRPPRVEKILLAAQAVALAGRFQFPLVRFTQGTERTAGVRLVVGTAAEVHALFDPSETKPLIAGPTVKLLERGDGPPMLIVSGDTEEDIAAAIERLVALARAGPVGSASGLRAARNAQGLRVFGGEHVRLADLGYSSSEFAGRFFRLGIDVVLPPDFLSADYGKLIVDLAGGYAGGLVSDAQIRIEVNGRDGANVALPEASGDVFRHNEIFVPLGLLRPGPNRIEILAQLQNVSDTTCDAASPAERAPRFLLLDASEIRFPTVARIGRLPDLRTTVSGAFPYATSRALLHVPAPDRAAMAAAMTLALHMAVAAQAIVPFEFTPGVPTCSGNVLIVAPAQALDPAMMTKIGLDPNAVRSAWENRRPVPTPAQVGLRGSVPQDKPPSSARNTSAAGDASAPASQSGGASGSGDLTRRWADRFSPTSTWDALSHAVADRWSRVVTAVVTPLRNVNLFDRRSANERNAIDPTALFVLAQGVRSNDGTDVVTIATAPDSESLWRAVQLLVQPAHQANFRGRLSMMDGDGEVVRALDAVQIRYQQTQPFHPENVRLLAAGWLSLNPLAYVGGMLFLAALLAAATFWLVRNVGRSNT